MKKYSTNITDNQWQFIKNTLELDDRAKIRFTAYLGCDYVVNP
jgi:hypothetical protein